jgi:hypothetical protein
MHTQTAGASSCLVFLLYMGVIIYFSAISFFFSLSLSPRLGQLMHVQNLLMIVEGAQERRINC